MNKKKLITMAASLGLVAVIGVGATLAYMTSATEEKTNTFTVGHISAELEETTKDPNGDERAWDDDKDGKDMYPGESVYKMPSMIIKGGSAASYVFLKVTGADELVTAGFTITSGIAAGNIQDSTVSAFNDKNWVKVANEDGSQSVNAALNGFYRYQYDDGNSIIGATEADLKLIAPIFDMVTYKTTNEGNANLDSNGKPQVVGKVTVAGCAVQADGLSAEEAFAQAKFKPLAN